MEFSFKIISVLLLVAFLSMVQGKPVDETALSPEQDEMMETAESQNPFLPRFAMKRLKERREQARAERRNGGARMQPQQRVKCPQNPYRRYYVSIPLAFL